MLVEGVTCSADLADLPAALVAVWDWGSVKTHAAPAFELSPYPPTTAVFASAESATEEP